MNKDWKSIAAPSNTTSMREVLSIIDKNMQIALVICAAQNTKILGTIGSPRIES